MPKLNVHTLPKVQYNGIGTLPANRVALFEISPKGNLTTFTDVPHFDGHLASALWYATKEKFPKGKFALCEVRADECIKKRYTHLLICVTNYTLHKS